MEQTELKYVPAEFATERIDNLLAAILCIRAQLLLVAEFARTVAKCPDLAKRQLLHLESAHEEVTHGLLDELQALIQKVAHTPAQSLQELNAKAKVWLTHEVSKSDDDVLTLATSICEDLTRLSDPKR